MADDMQHGGNDDQQLRDERPNSDVRPNRSGQHTRQQLIQCASELFADRGVANVTLQEITAAAGQRNNSAIRYHFGDKEKLVAKIIEEHHMRISEEPNEWSSQATKLTVENGPSQVRATLDLLVSPYVEYGFSAPHGDCFLIIVAELIMSCASGDRAVLLPPVDFEVPSWLPRIHDSLEIVPPDQFAMILEQAIHTALCYVAVVLRQRRKIEAEGLGQSTTKAEAVETVQQLLDVMWSSYDFP